MSSLRPNPSVFQDQSKDYCCSCCFCCFRNCNPYFVISSALVAALFSFGFLIWGLADLWFKKRVPEGFYITGFVITCVIILLLNIILILLCCRIPNRYTCVNTMGKIFCLIVMLLAFLAFAFLLVANICLLVYYGKGRGPHGQAHDWFAIFIPFVIMIFANLYIIFCMNYLCFIFSNNAQDVGYSGGNIGNTPIPNNSFVVTGNNDIPPIGQPVNVIPNIGQPIYVYSGTNLNQSQ